MTERRICAVIPAAGRGTRLGADVPKIMLELAEGVTVWHLLHGRLRPWVEHVHVVVSPSGEDRFRRLVAEDVNSGIVSVSVQDEPRGMGDAIFGCAEHWDTYDTILVVWGDQANLSPVTLQRVVHAHKGSTTVDVPGLTIPLVEMDEPYVEYDYDPASSTLQGVHMSREGDECRARGLSDVGVFCLSTQGPLASAWQDYLAEAVVGATTGEVNFLPFLPYLARDRHWPVTVVPVTDPNEARGINTLADLEFTRRTFRQCAN